jgi:predicted DNA-binding protein
MYSPKIRPEQVERLYKLKLSKNSNIPMTKMVREAIEEYLTKNENNQEVKNENTQLH